MKQTLLFFALFTTLTLSAQPPEIPQERLEKMKAHKIAYITTKLEFTPEEAQVFWPIYNEKERKLQELRQQKKQQKGDNLDAMSDKEISAMIDNHLLFRQQELDLHKEYSEKFKEVLPIRKVAKLHKAEEGFKRELLMKLRGERPPHPPQHPSRPH